MAGWKPEVDQPTNPLFTNGENSNMNACVGDNGGPYGLFGITVTGAKTPILNRISFAGGDGMAIYNLVLVTIFELSMRFRLCAVLFLSLPLLSCMYRKHDRNGPSDVSIMKSPQDIIMVFEKECIEQSHIRWARDESRVRMQECGYFDSGDCRDSVDGWADWKIPVDNGIAVLTLSWSSVENERRLRKADCTLTLPRSTVAFKPAVIAEMRRRGRSDGALLVNDEALQGTAQLPSRSVEVGRSTSYEIEDGWEVRYRER